MFVLPLIACGGIVCDAGGHTAAAADSLHRRRATTSTVLMGTSTAVGGGGVTSRSVVHREFPALPNLFRVGRAEAIPGRATAAAVPLAAEAPWWLDSAWGGVLLANALTVMLTAIGGDLLSQSLEGSFSLLRTLRFTLFRVCAGMPLYASWIMLVERANKFVPRRARPAAKTAFECMIYTPMYQLFFFWVMGLSDGRSAGDALGRCMQLLPSTLPASWKFWAPVQLFTYGVCPIQWRVAWVNVVSLMWNAIMSSFNAVGTAA